VKNKKKAEKPKINFEVSGNCSFEFSSAYVEAGSLEEAKKKIADDIEWAVEAAAGMTCGFSVDNVEAEADMRDRCAVCGVDHSDLSKEHRAIVDGLAPLELGENEAIGAPFLDGEFVCPKCMDPRVRGKRAQKFRRHYMKVFRNYPNG